MNSPRRRQKPSKRTVKKTAPARRARVREYSKAARRSLGRYGRENMFDAPEIYHEPTGKDGFEIIVADPGYEYCHVVTPDQVRTCLDRLPPEFLKGLEVIQLSTMTKKKRLLPCYGLQWGCAIYLYPFHESLEEDFATPPPMQMVIETKMYGGRWVHTDNLWKLIWTESTARDYHLNNILVHELGHLVDTWNTNSADQERYAEWFAIEYGYRRTSVKTRRRSRKTRRRHHR